MARHGEAAHKTQQLWAAALTAGWDDGGRMCRSASEVADWSADMTLRFELAQKREADAAAAGLQVQSFWLTSILSGHRVPAHLHAGMHAGLAGMQSCLVLHACLACPHFADLDAHC